MAIEISRSTKEQTTRCVCEFGCLSGPPAALCRVKELMVGEALMIDCTDDLPCNYKESFGRLAICLCPTRKEIHFRFGI